MMRKGIVLIGVIISIIAMCVVCNAETMVRHDVAGFDISVEIPEDWYYVDRATEEDDPVINGIRMSLEEIRENFEENNFAFFATSRPLSKTASSVLSVNFSLWDFDDEDFNDYSDAELQEMSRDYAEHMAIAEGATVVNAECVGDKLKFLKAVVVNNNDNFELSYLTSYNDVTYSFLCYYDESDLLDKAESFCDAIVCSLEV